MTHPAKFFGLVRAMGAVHLAVGLSVAFPGKIPLGLAAVAGLVAFVLAGARLSELSPEGQFAFGYAMPVALCGFLHVRNAAPAGWDSAQVELARFWSWLVLETPPAAYVMVALYMLTRREPPPPADPFPPVLPR